MSLNPRALKKNNKNTVFHPHSINPTPCIYTRVEREAERKTSFSMMPPRPGSKSNSPRNPFMFIFYFLIPNNCSFK